MANGKHWYKNAVFYELHVRAFMDSNGDGHGDLVGLTQRLDYLKDLGIDCIWILPTYPSPLIDDGYDVADYYSVHPDYGTLAEFKSLVKEVHKRDMRIITDLVINHTSDQHPWFQEARKSKDNPYRDYYVWSDDDQKFPLARVIFNDSQASNWTWDESSQQFYWHRFYPQQPDLNFDNTKVQEEMLKIIDFWLDLGIDGFRADAVPYLYQREGTNCDNLPGTHQYLKRIRSFMDENYPEKVLLVEANQWPEEVIHYFGDGDEAHMAFHFPIMPRIFMSLKQADRTSMVEILKQTPPIPEGCQWCIFLRNHDELTLEMVTPEQRQWMWEQYAPEPRMRINLGIRRRLAPLLDNDRRRIELVNSILFTLPGSPIIYYGDEIGMGDNIWLPDRNSVRTPMQWDEGHNSGFSTTQAEALYAPVVDSPEYNPQKINATQQMQDSSSLYHFTKRLSQFHKQITALGQSGFSWAELLEENLSIAAYWRGHEEECLLAIHNLSPQEQKVIIRIPSNLSKSPQDMFSGTQYQLQAGGTLTLTMAPYKYLWLHFNSEI